jgi:hypothetical protein
MMCVDKSSLKYVDDKFSLIVVAFFSRILLLIGVDFAVDYGISSRITTFALVTDFQRRYWKNLPFNG